MNKDYFNRLAQGFPDRIVQTRRDDIFSSIEMYAKHGKFEAILSIYNVTDIDFLKNIGFTVEPVIYEGLDEQPTTLFNVNWK